MTPAATAHPDYWLAANSDDDFDAVLDVYMVVDGALRAGDFVKVNTSLTALEPSTLAPVVALAWLSISWAARDRLPAFDSYHSRVRSHFTVTFPGHEEELLRGFGHPQVGTV